MGELGSIFDGAPGSGTGAKGPDIRVQATVPRRWLGAADGVFISTPDRVPFEGSTVARSRGPDDPKGGVTLHLSAELGERTTLRLRGQGGEHPGKGRPGDLLVTVTIVDDQPRRWGWMVAVVLVAAAGAATAWWGYGRWWG
ncbi:MAG: hypothetical protein K0V04_44585 [Deltaproteobacteria bacterium]|nr:hypothetical protein [Deltaproteobacteria bacterium]